MEPHYFYLLIGIIYSLSLFIGWKHKGKSQSGNQYLLGKKQFSTGQLTLTILAAQLGGGSLVGTCESALTYGWLAGAYGIGMALGLYLIGFFFAGRLQQLPTGTISTAMGHLYDAKPLQWITGLLSICTLFCILLATAVAMRKLFSFAEASDTVFLLFWAAFVTYTVMGGLHAVVLSDVVQALCILAIFIALVMYMFLFPPAAQEWGVLLQDSFRAETVPWVDWILLPAFFIVISQDMGQRCFAATSPKSIQQAMMYAPILLLLCVCIPLGLGILSKNLGLPTVGDKSTLLETVRLLTNPTMTALVTAAVLMAIISTADSLLCAISSNLGFDFGLGKHMRFLQVSTAGIGVLAAWGAFHLTEIIPTLLLGYELSVCMLLVPFVGALLFGFRKKQAAYGAMALGGILYGITWWWPFTSCLGILGLNTVVYIALTFFYSGGRSPLQTSPLS